MKRPRRFTGEITLYRPLADALELVNGRPGRPDPRLYDGGQDPARPSVTTIRVNTDEYERAHRRAPRGYGTWALWLGDRSGAIEDARWFTGTWSFAKGEGKAWARKMNATTITLGS